MNLVEVDIWRWERGSQYHTEFFGLILIIIENVRGSMKCLFSRDFLRLWFLGQL